MTAGSDSPVRARPTRRLAAETTLVVGLGVVVTLAGFELIASIVVRPVAWGWLGLTTATFAWELGYLWQNRHTNQPVDGEQTRPTLGVANLVTLLRGVAFAGVAGFLAVEPTGLLAWGPAVLYGIGVLLDGVDGLLARTVGARTMLGQRLDHAFDTLGFLLAPVVAVVWGQLPVWYLSLAVARYVYRLGVWLYERQGGTPRSLPEPTIRRPLAAVQMAFLAVVLTPVVSPGVASVGAIPVVVATLAVFAWDYLYVVGRVG